MGKSVWIYAQLRKGKPVEVTYELLNEAGKITEEGDEISVITCGRKSDIEKAADELCGYGIKKIYAAYDERLGEYTSETYVKALEKVIKENDPDILLLGATALGRDLGPSLAAALETGLTADCTRLDIDDEKYLEYILENTAAKADMVDTKAAEGLLKATKPAFSGNLLATIYTPYARPQMASVRAGVFDRAWKKKDTENEKPEVVWYDPCIKDEDIKVKVKTVREVEDESAGLKDAEIVVAGGRGLVDMEGFELLKEFANLIGAEVGVSRSLVDNGWADVSMQIGQSGITIAPKLYINFGISGVIQHTAGILGSECIVSVNNDEKAPIFEVSDYCIAGDAKACLKEFIAQLKK